MLKLNKYSGTKSIANKNDSLNYLFLLLVGLRHRKSYLTKFSTKLKQFKLNNYKNSNI